MGRGRLPVEVNGSVLPSAAPRGGFSLTESWLARILAPLDVKVERSAA